jgi:cell division protein ZapD
MDSQHTQFDNQYNTFVQPLNERLRFFMRLAFLFRQIQHAMRGDTVHDGHTAFTTLLDVVNLVNQQDLKKEVMKELERINQNLLPLQNSPDIQRNTLSEILESLQKYRSELHAITGPIAQELRDNEFLKSLQQKNNIPGGLTECDPPVYNYWLHQDPEIRLSDLRTWLNAFEPLPSSIELILDLIRGSTGGVQKTAENGLYQQTLDTHAPYQMVMVKLPATSKFFAEISGGKHRFTVRFMDSTSKPRPAQAHEDVVFELYCCAL